MAIVVLSPLLPDSVHEQHFCETTSCLAPTHVAFCMNPHLLFPPIFHFLIFLVANHKQLLSYAGPGHTQWLQWFWPLHILGL